MEELLVGVLEIFFEGILEVVCDALFCGLWSDRDSGFDAKPRRKGLP